MRLLLLLLAIMPISLFAQRQSKVQTIDWGNESVKVNITEEVQREYLTFEGATMVPEYGLLPAFTIRYPVAATGQPVVTLQNAVYEPLEKANLIQDANLISSDIQIDAAISYHKKSPYLTIVFVPIRKNELTGQYEKLIQFSLDVQFLPTAQTRNTRSNTYASSSVLKTGKWHKIGTSREGMYKLSYTFLKDSLQVDVASINPKTLQLFGNGGGMLPEEAGNRPHDDLVENAIVVVGEQDGSFDAGDYILFYGTSPDQVFIDSGAAIFHKKHLYDDYAYYFLIYNQQNGKRIQTQNYTGPENGVVTTFDDYQFIENDLYNLARSGREWYGDRFDMVTSSRTYNFSFPNINTTYPLVISTDVAARSAAVNNLSFNVTYNGNHVHLIDTQMGNMSMYDGAAAIGKSVTSTVTPNSSSATIQVNFNNNGDTDAKGYLNYINIHAKRNLVMAGDQMIFYNKSAAAPGAVNKYILQASQSVIVLDITDPVDVKRQITTGSGSYSFVVQNEEVKKFIAYTGSQFYTPTAIGTVANQNIHATIGQPDYVIVTPAQFLSQANQLADFHRTRNNLQVYVVEIDKVYNEFSSGAQDVTAIRDMMKMLYDRASNSAEMPQYLLLLGDGSYDYKNIEYSAQDNTNLIPAYQTYQSLNIPGTYTTDDYYALLDDGEGYLVPVSQTVDISVGRFPVRNTAEATAAVNKILHYKSAASLGNWRNNIIYVADDEDGNAHIDDVDIITENLRLSHQEYNVDKIYFDAFNQLSTPGGSRYPDVNQAFTAKWHTGSLVINYMGHGGETGWAHERVFTLGDIQAMKNLDKLPLFVTATCSFSPFDRPDLNSAGEMLFTKEDGGAIALVSTLRITYIGENRVFNTDFSKVLFEPTPTGGMPTMGEAVMMAKAAKTHRKIVLLGDPALKLNYPTYNVSTTSINTNSFVTNQDTLKALAKVTITGQVEDHSGNKMSNFNGVVYPTIYDKVSEVTTLANDPGSQAKTFNLQKNIIYKGKASVNAGEFSFQFIVPKDIAYNIGPGKINYYAHNDQDDANGSDFTLVGGSADSAELDNTGPEVEIFMNDLKFVFGGLTDESPLMIVKLYDEHGINTAGTAIGHDISGLLDEEQQNKLMLNDFYEAELDDFTRGTVSYPLSKLEPGRHTISVKAWDVYNNSGEGYTEFMVAKSADLALAHVLNYPNPFTTNTAFWFEHNKPGQMLNVQVQIFTVSGKILKTINRQIMPEGYRVDEITWNGLDDFGDKIGKGVYIYQLKVRSEDGSEAREMEKLVILQ